MRNWRKSLSVALFNVIGHFMGVAEIKALKFTS
jgi:hypothetical protein